MSVTQENYEIISGCCVKLYFVVICYTAVENYLSYTACSCLLYGEALPPRVMEFGDGDFGVTEVKLGRESGALMAL